MPYGVSSYGKTCESSLKLNNNDELYFDDIAHLTRDW